MYGLNIAVVGVEGMDGCEEAVSTGDCGAGGKEGGGSFWDMAFSLLP